MSHSPKILVIVNVFHPDLGGGVLFSDLCHGLAERGFDVTARCAYPYYPEWKDKSGQNGLRITRTEEAGLHVERFGLYIPSNPNGLVQRLVYEASFFFSLLRRIPRRGTYDAIMVFCPLIGAVAYGAICKRLNGGPLWLNVQDLAAEAAAASGITKAGSITRLFARIQNSLFNHAHVWSSIAPVMIERLSPHRRKQQPLLLIPNWLHTSLAEALREMPTKVERSLSQPVKLLYSGNIGTKQDLLLFCRYLHQTDTPFQFRIQGGGGRAEEVRTWIEHSSDTRFSFHALTDEAGLAHALHETDFFVITEKTGSGGSFIPSKLIPGIASGTPILAVCDAESPLGQEMETSHPGPRFDWANLDAIGATLDRLTQDPSPFHTWQHNALQRAQAFDREMLIDRYATALHALIEAISEGHPLSTIEIPDSYA